MLTTPATQDCMGANIKRKFNGNDLVVNGKKYRIECQLKQKVSPFAGSPHIKAIALFTKWTGSRWKNSTSPNKITLNLRGNVYNELTCSDLFTILNKSITKNKRSEIKIKTADYSGVPSGFKTRRSLPFAINADFIWFYNSNQSTFGNYLEVLKP